MSWLLAWLLVTFSVILTQLRPILGMLVFGMVCFFFPNWMWSGFGDKLYKAEYYTNGYNIFWWFFSILSTLFVAWLYDIVGTIRTVFSNFLEKEN